MKLLGELGSSESEFSSDFSPSFLLLHLKMGNVWSSVSDEYVISCALCTLLLFMVIFEGKKSIGMPYFLG